MAVKPKSDLSKRAQAGPKHDEQDLGAADWPPAELGFLDPPIDPGPAFPIDLLPTQVGKLVSALSTIRKVTIDYVACAAIGAASAAIGNRARILAFDARLEPLTLSIGVETGPLIGVETGPLWLRAVSPSGGAARSRRRRAAPPLRASSSRPQHRFFSRQLSLPVSTMVQ